MTDEILKNKGLTKYRRKEDRNARVKNRTKFSKALKRHHKAVQPVREKTEGYCGEATGIRSRTVKSVRLN